MRREFSLLLSSQKTKTLLLLNGFIPLAEVDYSLLRIANPALLHAHYDGTLRAIVAEEAEGRSVLYLAEYEAAVLSSSKEHLIKFNCLLSYISEIVSFVEVAYDQAELIVRDILRQYNSKINLIDDPSTPLPTQTWKTSTRARSSSASSTAEPPPRQSSTSSPKKSMTPRSWRNLTRHSMAALRNCTTYCLRASRTAYNEPLSSSSGCRIWLR